MIEKECDYCKNKFLTVRNKTKFCSHKCSTDNNKNKTLEERGWSKESIEKNDKRLKDKKFNEHKSKLYKGKTLEERGWSEKSIEKDKQVKIERNKKLFGKTVEEIYGVDKAKIYRNKMSEIFSDGKSPNTIENIAKRNNCSLEEARKFTGSYGRTDEKHPMFGKHHSIESKIKMMESMHDGSERNYFVANGYFNNIYWQGTYELKFIIDNIELKNNIKRYDLSPIEYIFEGITHHYFPDFIIDDKIIEIKGYSRENTIIKTESGKKLYGENYLFIEDVGQNIRADIYYKITKEKYKDRLIINYNPHEVLNEGS